MTGIENTDVKFTGSTAGGTLSASVTGGRIYDVVVSGMTTSGSVGISLLAGAADDGAGNDSEATAIPAASVEWVQIVDNTDPTVIITPKAGQVDPTSTSPIQFTVTFSPARLRVC